MKKNIILFFCFILIAVLVVASFLFLHFFSKNSVKNTSAVNDTEIIKILETNKDIKDYSEKYSDFKITDKEILTKESILAGQKGQNFQAVYAGLSLEDNRYMKINLMDKAGENGFVSVIDFKNNSVIKSFGILLFKVSANGQTTSQK